MNTKSLAMIATLGLLAGSLAYVAPAMADDLSGDLSPSMTADTAQPGQGTMGPATAPGSAVEQAGAASMNPANNVGTLSPGSNPDMNTPNNPETMPTNNTDASATMTPEQGSPDTATGDDDY